MLRLWEALWTDWLSSQFHLFIALAILEKHRTVIMEHLKHFDEVLKYSRSTLSEVVFMHSSRLVRWTSEHANFFATVNELSSTIDLQTTLINAETLFRRFQRTVDAIDKKDTFPAPSSMRQRKPTAMSPSSPSSPPPPTPSSDPNAPAPLDGPAKSASSRTGSSQNNSADSPATSGADVGNRQVGGRSEAAKGKEREKEQVISPELRRLLSREVVRIEG